LFPPSFFDRANRGLLVEARAPEAAGASPATGTSEEECVSTCSHAADERCDMAGRRTGLVWAAKEELKALDALFELPQMKRLL
jgi:hypothetical protein